jgi:hypothetical protein
MSEIQSFLLVAETDQEEASRIASITAQSKITKSAPLLTKAGYNELTSQLDLRAREEGDQLASRG